MISVELSKVTFRRAARLLGRASAFAAAICFGHMIGFLLVYWRLRENLRLHNWKHDNVLNLWGWIPTEILSYQPWAGDVGFYKYPGYSYGITDPVDWNARIEWGAMFVAMFLSMLVVVSAALIVVRFSPIRFTPGSFVHAPESVRAAVLSNWRWLLSAARLNQASRRRAAMAVGFATAIFTEATCTIQEWHAEMAWERGGMAYPLQHPRPLWGMWTGADLVLVLGSCFVLTAGVVILDARRRWADDAALRNQWCVGCGYPALSTGLAGAATSSTCPECGRKANPQPSAATRIKHSAFWFNVAVTAVLAGSMLVFFAVPRVLPQQP